MEKSKDSKLEEPIDKNITLESLLDAPPSNCASMENVLKRKILDEGSYVIHPVPLHKRSRGQLSRAKEACLELIAILLQQDVNGFFHFVLKRPNNDNKLTKMCLRTLERYIHTNKVKNLAHLREYVEEFFSSFQNDTEQTYSNPPARPLEGWSAVCSEANRLLLIAKRWYDSIGMESSLMHEPLYQSVDDTQEVTALGLLNPDNKGLVSATERVRTIGEEVGPLHFGTYLSPNGGYREDRRNRVIPYTYLNYGPYSTFGPSFDSGASNCSPEANQLLLSTTWLPGRMLYSLESIEGDSLKEREDESDDCPWSRLRCVPEAEQDEELQAALSECVAEWKESNEASKILDEVIPTVVFGDHPDGDFNLYLANAITRNLPVEKNKENDDNTAGAVVKTVDESSADQEVPKVNDEKTTELNSAEEVKNVELLVKSSKLLRDLYNSQQRRLGDFSPASLAEERTLRPSQREMRTATELASTLVDLIGKVTKGPGDILLSRAPVRRALGLDSSALILPPSPETEMTVDGTVQ
ncbi:unnamed protein product [Rodentolepis nana]|uniref:SET domain-containing protein n=1 Tax=Rodentolepis nana TaxID=102285 RepID=A0A0R3T9R3_RODNA|nr:unnamed protein product [Rodentolepis nana]